MAKKPELLGVVLADGDELAQLGVRIASSTIARVKRQAERHGYTISGATDELLKDALHQYESEQSFHPGPK